MTMFITIDELKNYLKINNAESDESLTNAIKEATSFIQTYTWRHLLATYYTDIIDGRGENAVILKDTPANSIASFEYNAGTISSPIWKPYREDGYWLNKEEWIIRTTFWLQKWIQNNKIVYNAWYTVIPDDIKHCTYLLSTSFFSKVWKIKQWVVKESVDGASIEYDLSNWWIDDEIYVILDKYKVYYI